MPVVRVRGGWLKIGRRRRPGEPDIGLPDEEGPVDPDYGIPEGELPEVEPPDPPPGIWPPPTPSHPIVPMPPGEGTPGHLPAIPPGAIWPRPPGTIEGKFIVLAHIPGHGWKYIVIDPDAWTPEHLPEMPGTPQPKR